MALDPKARDVTINYDGGYCNMTRGLAEFMFGTDFAPLAVAPKPETVSVKAHSRTRVIGQPSTNVAAHTYTYDKYPTSTSELAEGGQPVMVNIGEDSDWTVRVGGPLYAFVDFLDQKVQLDAVFVTSQRGTKYGPVGVNIN